ncbi:MAG: hypothetical protein HC908_04745 [Calothrix sp. SM1_7_51]|nr:hypothetical protein [Calothrix sp. SM1_7_51]
MISLPDTTSENVAEVLSTKQFYADSSEATYLDKTALLFYSYDKGNLQIWLVNKDGIQGSHKQPEVQKY